MQSTRTISNLKAANRAHVREIKRLERRIAELVEQAASASLSSGAGSKSYTNHQISALRAEVHEHQAAISRNLARIRGGVGGRVYTVR